MFDPFYGCAKHEHISGLQSNKSTKNRVENFLEIRKRVEAKQRLDKRLEEKRQQKEAKKKLVNSQDGILSQEEEDKKYNVFEARIASEEARKQDAEKLRSRTCKIPANFSQWIKRTVGMTNRFFRRTPLAINGKALQIVSDRNYFAVHQFDSTGFRVWDMAVVLSRYLVLNKEFRKDMQNKRLIEIGCGMGVVSLATALMGGAREIVATDADKAALNNINVNKHLLIDSEEARESFKISKLLFGNMDQIDAVRDNRPFDIIFATDIFYLFSIPLMKDIARTIIALAADIDAKNTNSNGTNEAKIIAYIGYQERQCCEYGTFLEFLKELSRHGLFYRHVQDMPEPYNDTINVKAHLIEIMKPYGLTLSLKAQKK
eukprot:g5827.t1